MTVHLNRLPHQLREDFKRLPSPEDFDALTGAHRAIYVGPRPLREASPFAMSLLGFHNWYGKRFTAGENGAAPTGVNRWKDGDESHDRLSMIAAIGPSLVDGRDAYVVTYPADSPIPWRWARDEFRPFDDTRLLGMTVFDLPVLRSLPPLAFVLDRETVGAAVQPPA